MTIPVRMSLGEVARDVCALFDDRTRDWVARNGTEIKQVGHLVFVIMPHRVPPAIPPVDASQKSKSRAQNMARAMDVLADGQAKTLDAIAEAMACSASTARRALEPLIKTGLVRRKAAEGELILKYAYLRP